MKPFLFSLLILLVAQTSFSQISKNQWLVGGSGNLSFRKATNYPYDSTKYSSLSISPNIGYFFLDRLAAGIRLGYDGSVTKGYYVNGIPVKQKSHSANLAPFVRYYFLSNRHPVNILADASYGRAWNVTKNNYGKSKSDNSLYSFAAGPVWFINPTAALELTLNYTRDNSNLYNSDVSVRVGFQLHFGSSKKKI